MARIKCSVCGLYRGAAPHSGALHRKIMANRERFRRGLTAHSGSGLGKRLGDRRKGERRRAQRRAA